MVVVPGLYNSIHSSSLRLEVVPAHATSLMTTARALAVFIWYVTETSVDVLAVLLLPEKSVTRLAAIDGMIVPKPDAAVADKVKFLLSPELARLQVTPVAVPFWVISDVVNKPELIGSENRTVKLIGNVLVGSV